MQQYVNYDELIKLMHMNICCFSVMFSNKKKHINFYFNNWYNNYANFDGR